MPDAKSTLIELGLATLAAAAKAGIEHLFGGDSDAGYEQFNRALEKQRFLAHGDSRLAQRKARLAKAGK